MSEHERDDAVSCLSSTQDMRVRNVRFARGSDDVISEPGFRADICHAAEQRRDGTATLVGWPKMRGAKVDVDTFIANI